ncbi:nuclear transport factor 2 family protein [Streptomyces sp. NPDC056716]|uniref:nuclear transport factor 2 family protein n=1 Tax=unclassified Streptomyces TaxID=2593676 RepID=UPI0036A9F912
MVLTPPDPHLGTSAAPADAVHHGIGSLMTRFGAAIDGKQAQEVAALFTDDCSFSPPTGEALRGRAAVAEFYEGRFADLRRRTCHTWANLQVFPESADRARSEAVMTTYAFEPSVSETHVQLRVGRVHGRCEQGSDGIWRFAEHSFEMAFPLSIPLKD